MPQLEHIEAIEKRLWSAADNLRANSNYASNEYFLPVMGLVFLRHAYSRYLAVKARIEPDLPSRGGKIRSLTKEDFSRQSAIFLRPKAQFDYLVALPDKEDRARAIIEAMESIEADYENLRGVLPKSEYQELDNQVLGQLLRTLNPDELKKVSGDVFGRIYEYFLTQFADQKAHDGGEFFTPVSLVSLIAHVLDPERGTVLDPACGSGGMFVQSARIVEEHGDSPTEKLTFRGLEKNATTIRLAKMNLAVPFLNSQPNVTPRPPGEGPGVKVAEMLKDLKKETGLFAQDIEQFRQRAEMAARQWEAAPDTNAALRKLTNEFEPLAEASRDLIKQADLIYKLATRLIDTCENECNAKESAAWAGRDITRARKAADESRGLAVEQLKQVRYFWKQAHWLTERFPAAKLRDVEGLVKLVDIKEIEANDWSLTPGRYVGVAPEEVDENFDFEEALREIHVELEDLNAEAVTLAATIKRNFEELGI